MLPHSTPWSRLLPLTVAAIIALQPATSLADKAADDFNLGVGLWRKQRWTPSAETFEQFLKDYGDHPRVPLAHFYLGLCNSSLQKYALSRDHFEEFLRLDPKSTNTASARYRIGECSYYLGEYEQAATQLTDYVQNHPDHKLVDWGNLQLGESFIQLKRYEEAEPLLKQLLESSSNEYITGQAQYSLALSLERQQQPDAAVQAYRQVAELDDERQAARALARAGTIRFRQQRYEHAAAFYDQITARFPKSRLAPSAALNSGLALYRVRKFEEAIRRFDQVSEQAQERTEATLLSGKALARLDRLEESRDKLRTAYEAAGDGELAAEAMFEMARVEQQAGDNQLALQMYVDLADRWPKDRHTSDALFNAAGLSLDLNDSETAQRLLDRLSTDFPQQAARSQVRFLAGRVLLEQDKPTEAREALQAVTTSSDADARSVALSLYYIARIDHEQQEYAAALRAVQRLRPVLDDEANRDLRGALALGAMSAIELEDFPTAGELATAYLKDGDKQTQAADALAARTVAHANTGDFPAAVLDAERLITMAPENPQTWTAVLQSAERAMDEQQYDAARELFQRCSAEPAPITTRRSGSSGVGWALFYLKRFAEAAKAFGETADAWPESSTGLEARYMAAHCLQEDGQTDAAIQEFAAISRDFAELIPTIESPSLQQRLRKDAMEAGRIAARTLHTQGRVDESNEQYSALVDRFPDFKDLDALLDEWAWHNLQSER